MRLLPEYDVYVMGFREREHLVSPPCRSKWRHTGKRPLRGPAALLSS